MTPSQPEAQGETAQGLGITSSPFKSSAAAATGEKTHTPFHLLGFE